MAKSKGMVDLGREYSACEPCVPQKSDSKKKKVSYPCLYISGVEGLDFATGEISGTFKGRVISVSERSIQKDGEDEKEEYSCEIEVHAIRVDESDASEGGLEESLEKISRSKEKYG